MGKIVNGVANDFEFDMFPPNVEKIIITKENYNRLFKGLEEENKILEKGCKEYRYHIKQMNKIHDNCLNTIETLQDRIDNAIEYIKWDMDKNEEYIEYCNFKDNYEKLLDILKGE